MRNPDWNLDAFALQWKVDTDELVAITNFMLDKGAQLGNTEHPYHPYAVDHANEHLAHAAKRLREIANTFDSLREYTNYPPTPEAMAKEAAEVLAEAGRRALQANVYWSSKKGSNHE